MGGVDSFVPVCHIFLCRCRGRTRFLPGRKPCLPLFPGICGHGAGPPCAARDYLLVGVQPCFELVRVLDGRARDVWESVVACCC